MRCLDPEAVIPISRRSTAEAFKTGTWSTARPVFREKCSPCRASCPNGNNLPFAFYRAARGDFDGALAALLEENPFPSVCGTVCYQPCRETCNRGVWGDKVEIRALEGAIGRLGRAHPSALSRSGGDHRVAVVGAGPAGLSAAFHLARLGHPVTVIEAEGGPGGLLAGGIPPFRLPRSVLEADLERIFSLPIELKTGTRLEGPGVEELLEDFEAVFLGVGAGKSRRLGLEGEELGGVVDGLEFLKGGPVASRARGRQVVVIGGGNTAVDAARTALRSGALGVTILYRRTRDLMPAFEEEIRVAEAEGVRFEFLAGPVEFLGDAGGGLRGLRLVRNKVVDPEGNIEPEPGRESDLQCDLAVVAVGQAPDRAILLEGLRWEEGRIWTDAMGRTSLPRIYAGGDLTRTKAAVVDAIASGKLAAMGIHADLTGLKPAGGMDEARLGSGRAMSIAEVFRPRPAYSPYETVALSPLQLLAASGPPFSAIKEAGERLGSAEVRAEALRCLYCGTCIQCDRCYLYCPEMAVARPTAPGGMYGNDPDYCKGCGVCSAECVRGVISMSEAT